MSRLFVRKGPAPAPARARQRSVPVAALQVPAPPPTSMRARGQPRETGMNKTEAAYAAELERQRALGHVVWWAFEAVKLRLADKTFYTPDFAVLRADGFMELHEVKGFWEDDARVKIKVAAAQYPFHFVGVTKDGRGWAHEHF